MADTHVECPSCGSANNFKHRDGGRVCGSCGLHWAHRDDSEDAAVAIAGSAPDDPVGDFARAAYSTPDSMVVCLLPAHARRVATELTRLSDDHDKVRLAARNSEAIHIADRLVALASPPYKADCCATALAGAALDIYKDYGAADSDGAADAEALLREKGDETG